MTIQIASRVFSAFVALLILAGCGGNSPTLVIATPTLISTSAPLPGSPPAPTSAPGGLNFARTITNADNGGTVQIHVGDRISLALTAPSGSDPWQVASPDPQILKSVPHPGAAAVQGVTLQAFLAVGPGQAAIMATDRIHCTAGQSCAGAIQGFRVTVIVAP
ncbi:MAG: hypothetical protein ACYDAR_15470 [Thermomicrobiales bacterium]